VTTLFRSSVRRTLLALLCIVLCHPLASLARNGDDWVLVQRFQSQQKLAQAGDAAAMYEVGRMYELGRGTEPNMQKAVQWYERALNKGQNNARAHLGVLYYEGSGVNRDLKKAIGLLQPAAEAGNPTAQFYLGRMYEQGEGLRRDLNLAIHWYKKAADSGYYLAVARLKTLTSDRASSPPSPQKEASVQRTPRPAQTSRIESPATVLRQTIMNAKWERNGRPTGFLPSTNSTCTEKSGQTITCQSGEQQRNTGDAIITYATEATLSGFNNADQFEVNYFNNVHKVQAVARPSLDDEAPAPRVPPNIKLGKQSVIHKLRCELQSVDKLVCVKDNNLTDTYTRVK
jgi:hypothetical protein